MAEMIILEITCTCFLFGFYLVVDATMTGGPARYINHSCNPNCVAEVVAFEKDSKIIIITKRRLLKGEEVLYSCIVFILSAISPLQGPISRRDLSLILGLSLRLWS